MGHLCAESTKIDTGAFYLKEHLITAAQGAVIGGTMLIPGVSGGTMAMMLGVYDRLITSVSEFFRHKRQSLIFLLVFCLGAGLGMLLIAKPLLRILDAFPLPAGYFFMGAVAGSVPMIYQKARASSFRWRDPVYVIVGMAMVFLLSYLPADPTQDTAALAANPLYLILAGLIAAVALVLPGISVSYLMLMMGLYDKMVQAMDSLYLPFLIPLAVGLALGIISTAKVLDLLMTRHPRPTYLIILGFMLASVLSVFPGFPQGLEILACLLTFLAGFAVILRLSRL